MIAHGTRLGPYEVIARIGAGGCARCIVPSDTKLSRDVRLKIRICMRSTKRGVDETVAYQTRSSSLLDGYL
jgi:hypothetical protein